MGRMSFLQDIFSSVFERGTLFRSAQDDRSIVALCDAILSEKGEVSGSNLATNILMKFDELDGAEKLSFFTHLVDNLDLDPDGIIEAAESYRADRNAATLKRLTKLSDPPRQELLRRINQAPGATEKLVKMREELLGFLSEHPQLKCLDADFDHLFSSWFNRGFLVLRPIDWKTPANILEKIIEYEAVHTINDWDDLRRRLQPEDRRCFAFFHPAMPEEPLIFVEVALSDDVPHSVNELLAEARDPIATDAFNTAVFYSISNCQKGLKGVSFGNFLIKQVVYDLAQEFSGLKNFVTLSPVPGFRKWLEAEYAETQSDVIEAINGALAQQDMVPVEETLAEFEKPLTTLMAKYFVEGKRSDGKPVDPVARFHLGNGASLMRINWMADLSSNGFAQSACLMVNYKYDLATVEDNHETYMRDGLVNTTREIRSLSKADLK